MPDDPQTETLAGQETPAPDTVAGTTGPTTEAGAAESAPPAGTAPADASGVAGEEPEHFVPVDTFVRERVRTQRLLDEARQRAESAEAWRAVHEPQLNAWTESAPQIEAALERFRTRAQQADELEPQVGFYKQVLQKNNIDVDDPQMRSAWEQQSLVRELRQLKSELPNVVKQTIHSLRQQDASAYQARAAQEAADRVKTESDSKFATEFTELANSLDDKSKERLSGFKDLTRQAWESSRASGQSVKDVAENLFAGLNLLDARRDAALREKAALNASLPRGAPVGASHPQVVETVKSEVPPMGILERLRWERTRR